MGELKWKEERTGTGTDVVEQSEAKCGLSQREKKNRAGKRETEGSAKVAGSRYKPGWPRISNRFSQESAELC